MNIKELVFKNKADMSAKMEAAACEYEGFVPGRSGYNFPNKDGSYTIAYIRSDIITKNHELCHAKYYFDAKYRENVRVLWDSLSCEEQLIIKKFLKRCGYKEEFFLDEFQAYWFSEKEPRKFFGLKRQQP
jgi:hypothetical protein